MPESRSHKVASNRIAKRFKAEYNSQDGVDIVTPNIAVEVETLNTVAHGLQQLQGHKKPAYIAGANQETIDKALALTRGTTIGVMNNKGDIIKPSSRKKS